MRLPQLRPGVRQSTTHGSTPSSASCPAGDVVFALCPRIPQLFSTAVVPHPTVVATLAADHRVSDGHRGGLFLSAIDHLLQEPEKL